MTWKAGAFGERIELLDPYATPIDVRTIVHALAHIARYGGHTHTPISVAFHSRLVARILDVCFPPSAEVSREERRLAALVHDAHEAYVGDIATPIKAVLGPAWVELEQKWERRVQGYFGARVLCAGSADALHTADLMALVAERELFFPRAQRPWNAMTESCSRAGVMVLEEMLDGQPAGVMYGTRAAHDYAEALRAAGVEVPR